MVAREKAPAAAGLELLDLLGRGGAGETWRARRRAPHGDELVCVKRPVRAPSPAETRAWLEEARLLALGRGVGVVTLLEARWVDGEPWLVLELAPGGDLRARLRQHAPGGVSFGIAASLVAQVVRILSALQRVVPGGLVHRDLTPHNLLVGRAGELLLADFGIARALARESWTAEGIIKGKLPYLAPEVAAGAPASVQSDLYSLGVLLHELVTGRRPHDGMPAPRILEALCGGEPCPLVAASLPPAAVGLLRRWLHPDPAFRPRDHEQAARELAPHADDAGRRRLLAAWTGAGAAGGPGTPPPARSTGAGHGRFSVTMDVPPYNDKECHNNDLLQQGISLANRARN